MATDWLPRVQPIRAIIRAEGDTTVTAECVVTLHVRIGGQVTTAAFVVASKLATKMIFGMASIYMEIKLVETKNGQVVPSGGHLVAIV